MGLANRWIVGSLLVFGAALGAAIGPVIAGDRHYTLLDFTPRGVSALVAAATGLDYPSNRSLWMSTIGEIQGIAHDSENWYFSNTKTIVKVPLHYDLNDVPASVPYFKVPADLYPRWNHMGDPDQWGGTVYVPLEGAAPMMIFVDTATMREKGRSFVPPRDKVTSIPWIAVEPHSGLVSTAYGDMSDAPLEHMRVYRLSPQWQLELDHTVVLTDSQGSTQGIRLTNGQGAAYSDAGHFYVVSDADDVKTPACNRMDSSIDAIHLGCHGLYAFGPEEKYEEDAATPRNAYGVPTTFRRFLYFTPIARKKSKVNFLIAKLDTSEELEGLDIFPLAPGRSPGVSGLIHVTMAHQDAGLSHGYWLKHFDARVPEARPFF